MEFIKIDDHCYDVRNSDREHIGWMKNQPGTGTAWGFYVSVFDIDKGRSRHVLDYDPAVFADWDKFRNHEEPSNDYVRYCNKLFGRLPDEYQAAEASAVLFGRYRWNLKKSDRSLAGALRRVNDWRRRHDMPELVEADTYSII